jgi:hypothetical protein
MNRRGRRDEGGSAGLPLLHFFVPFLFFVVKHRRRVNHEDEGDQGGSLNKHTKRRRQGETVSAA